MNGLPLPDALLADLSSGCRLLSSAQTARLGALLRAIEKPFPALFDLDAMEDANRLWTSKHLQSYLGTKSAIYTPGDINPKQTVIIGQADPDSPIALDFRFVPPHVIYFGDIGHETYWLELSPCYEDLVAKIADPNADPTEKT